MKGAKFVFVDAVESARSVSLLDNDKTAHSNTLNYEETQLFEIA